MYVSELFTCHHCSSEVQGLEKSIQDSEEGDIQNEHLQIWKYGFQKNKRILKLLCYFCYWYEYHLNNIQVFGSPV